MCDLHSAFATEVTFVREDANSRRKTILTIRGITNTVMTEKKKPGCFNSSLNSIFRLEYPATKV